MALYPNNTLSSYTTKLDPPIDLRGHYEVGLVDIVFPRSWLNIKPAAMWLNIRKRESANQPVFIEHTVRLPAGHYDSVAHLITMINHEIPKTFKTDQAKFRYTYNTMAEKNQQPDFAAIAREDGEEDGAKGGAETEGLYVTVNSWNDEPKVHIRAFIRLPHDEVKLPHTYLPTLSEHGKQQQQQPSGGENPKEEAGSSKSTAPYDSGSNEENDKTLTVNENTENTDDGPLYPTKRGVCLDEAGFQSLMSVYYQVLQDVAAVKRDLPKTPESREPPPAPRKLRPKKGSVRFHPSEEALKAKRRLFLDRQEPDVRYGMNNSSLY
ncbi:hypothetical protein BaRGS_00038839 [Batillaria attramentaria]|uniref:Uncharacterized protein n=1 Tax=Batillaria attramentaria TaxID=370345 RepID=A0ABD0J563_9CAEN